MSDNRKEAEEKMAKAIFISGDGWLCVFDLLTPSQLGFGIALISHRFDFYVDEHFKTRKWTLKFIRIRSKNGKNGTKQMAIDNFNGKSLPIPQVQLPRKVMGFRSITISFIDQNAIAFLYHFRQLFATCPINLLIDTTSDRISKSILRNIWPLIAKNICGMELTPNVFRRLRKFVPSFLSECPSLRIFSSHFDEFIGFRVDDSAMASDGQSVAKWLITPHPSKMPKVFKCLLWKDDENLATKIEAFKAAFASTSSPANFIFAIWVLPFTNSVVPFVMTNELTREQLVLKGTNSRICFLLIRRPIARDESKWTKWEKEAIGWRIRDQWHQISIKINWERQIGDGLLDAIPGPSNQQK